MNDITPLYAAFHELQGKPLSIKQAQGVNEIVVEYDRRQVNDPRKLAYILATVYHETAKTMQPIEEYGKGNGLPYGKKLKMGGGPGKRVAYTLPDKLYYGRGLIQATWYENYEKLTKAALQQGKDWDFLHKPELMLQMAPSVWAAFHGMETGLYTGKRLSDYFNDDKTDYINARKIINGLDRAELIAGYAERLHMALFSS